MLSDHFRTLTAATGPCPCSARSPTSSTRGYSPVAFGETPVSDTSRRSGASTERSGDEAVASGVTSRVTTWKGAGDRFVDAV